jgi:hypothetical protein
MPTVATILAVLAFAGAAASWVAAIVFGARALREFSDSRPSMWVALVAWPFAVPRARGAAAEHATNANKALVAFMVCLLVGFAAFAASTNLHRFAK